MIGDLKNSNFVYNPDKNLHRSWFRFQKSEFFDNLSTFCETRSKRSVEVYRGKNLHPLPGDPPTDRDRNYYENATDVTDIINE